MSIKYTLNDNNKWVVDGYPYINLKKQLFEKPEWSENFLYTIGKVVSHEVYRNILRGENKILIVIQDPDKRNVFEYITEMNTCENSEK